MLGRSYLDERGYFRRLSTRRGEDKDRILSLINTLWERKDLTAEEQLRFADMLEDAGDDKRSLEIALPLVDR